VTRSRDALCANFPCDYSIAAAHALFICAGSTASDCMTVQADKAIVLPTRPKPRKYLFMMHQGSDEPKGGAVVNLQEASTIGASSRVWGLIVFPAPVFKSGRADGI
jgi:hypothetical protein